MNPISILGCGWLGTAVALRLIEKGYNVKGSTTRAEKIGELRAAGIQPFLINFLPEIQSTDSEEFFSADVLIITIPPRRKSGQTDVYLQQLDSIIRNMLSGTVRKVIFISSTSVYKENNNIVTEIDADPDSYLVQAEMKFTSSKKFKSTVLRFGGLYGPGRHPGKFLAGKKEVKGGDNPVNIIHQDDCVAIVDKLIEKEIWGETFNACSDHHPTKRAFYESAAEELNLEPPQFIHEDHTPYKIVSNEKLKRVLDFRFIH